MNKISIYIYDKPGGVYRGKENFARNVHFPSKEIY